MKKTIDNDFIIQNLGIFSKKIANGHAFTKHIVESKEFTNIKNIQEFQFFIEDVIKNHSIMKVLKDGRIAYGKDQAIVIVDPFSDDGGTLFKTYKLLKKIESLN